MQKQNGCVVPVIAGHSTWSVHCQRDACNTYQHHNRLTWHMAKKYWHERYQQAQMWHSPKHHMVDYIWRMSGCILDCQPFSISQWFTQKTAIYLPTVVGLTTGLPSTSVLSTMCQLRYFHNHTQPQTKPISYPATLLIIVIQLLFHTISSNTKASHCSTAACIHFCYHQSLVQRYVQRIASRQLHDGLGSSRGTVVGAMISCIQKDIESCTTEVLHPGS